MRCYRRYTAEYIKFTTFVSLIKHQDLTIEIDAYCHRISMEIRAEKGNPYAIEIRKLTQKTLNRLKHLNRVLTGNLTVHIRNISAGQINAIKQLIRAMFHNRNSVNLSYEIDDEIIFFDQVRLLILVDNFNDNQFRKMLEFTVGLAYQYRLSQIIIQNLRNNPEKIVPENCTVTYVRYDACIIEFP